MSASSTGRRSTTLPSLLEGTGKRMRHVKLRWGQQVNAAALSELVAAAYRDIRLRLKSFP
jgi:hypothetical protein